MQTWMPPPKPMCSAAFARPTSSRSGSAKTRGSRLAEPNSIEITSPRGIGVPADLDAVLEHPALEQLERRVPPDQLLDRSCGCDLARHEPLPLLAVAQQRADAVAERVHGRFVPGVQQHDDGRDDLVVGELPAVDPRSDERAHHVVARRAAPLLDQPEHVVAELGGRLRGRLRLLLGRVELVHLHVTMGPVEQVAVAIGRHAEQPADQRDRVRLREVVEEVEAVAREAVVEELVRELLGRFAQRFDRARRECRRDELADSRVLGRFDEEEAPAFDVPERLPPRVERLGLELRLRADMAEVAAEALVAQAGAHLCMARDEPAVEPLVVGDRSLLPQRVQCGIRVGDERRVCRVEGDPRKLLRAVTVKTAALAARFEEKYFHFPAFRLTTTVWLADERRAREARGGDADALQLESGHVGRVGDREPIRRRPSATRPACRQRRASRLVVLTDDASVPTIGVGWPELRVVVDDVVGPVVVLAGCPTTNIPVISAAWVSHWKT